MSVVKFDVSFNVELEVLSEEAFHEREEKLEEESFGPEVVASGCLSAYYADVRYPLTIESILMGWKHTYREDEEFEQVRLILGDFYGIWDPIKQLLEGYFNKGVDDQIISEDEAKKYVAGCGNCKGSGEKKIKGSEHTTSCDCVNYPSIYVAITIINPNVVVVGK